MNSTVVRGLFLVCISCVSGCVLDTQGIENQSLRDKVAACGAGLSDEAATSLGAAYNTLPFSAQGNADFKATAKEIIFSEIPEQDRLKAYEDYIQCIESRDFPTSPLLKKGHHSVPN
jgi:hypothetical protein